MAARVKPKLIGSSKGKVMKKTVLAPQQSGPIFSRLTVVWVTNGGIPFNTTGFFATLSRGNTIISIANFDRFGVVRFNNVRTLTTATFTLRIFRVSDGALFRTRTIPAGVETFAVIG